MRACFHLRAIITTCPIGYSFRLAINVQRATANVYVMFAVGFNSSAILIFFASYAFCSVNVFRARFLSQYRARVFLKDVFRGIFAFRPRFATGFSRIASYFQVFQVISDFRFLSLSFQMINGSGFRQVSGNKRASDATIRIISCEAFRRDSIVRHIMDNVSSFVGGFISEFKEVATATRATSYQRAEVVPTICRTFFRRYRRIALARRYVTGVRFVRFHLAKAVIIRIFPFFRPISGRVMGQTIRGRLRHARKVNGSFRRIALSINRIMRQVNFPYNTYTIIQIFCRAVSSQVTRIRVKVDRIGLYARRRDTFFSLATVRLFRGFRTFFSEAVPMQAFRAQLNEDSFLLYGLFKDLLVSVYFSFLCGTSDRIPWLLRMIKDVVLVSPLMAWPLSVFLSDFCMFRVFLNEIYIIRAGIACASVYFYGTGVGTGDFNVASIGMSIELKQRTHLRFSSVFAFFRVFLCYLLGGIRTFLFAYFFIFCVYRGNGYIDSVWRLRGWRWGIRVEGARP